jgi:hypothetical protein
LCISELPEKCSKVLSSRVQYFCLLQYNAILGTLASPKCCSMLTQDHIFLSNLLTFGIFTVSIIHCHDLGTAQYQRILWHLRETCCLLWYHTHLLSYFYSDFQIKWYPVWMISLQYTEMVYFCCDMIHIQF